jgi:hypothetical protein
VVVLAVLLLSIVWSTPHLGSATSTITVAELGHLPTIPTMTIPAATVVQPCPYSTTVASCHQATIVVSHQQLSMLQLWEDGSLCSRMPPTQGKQLIASPDTCGQSVEGPSEGSCSMGRTHQLHHRGGDSHGRRSASRYILPQLTSCYYSVRF